MSKINAVRFINLNYNNGAIRISDETFHLNGESTLLSLQNGGGKSVLVQMMMAPFVHRRYQNAKDRPFSGYFTTSKPTFIMVEWKLDLGAGYVLTGMMVRRSQEQTEERKEELEVVNFISEYKAACTWDIHHLPVVEKTKKEVVLKGFHVCRQLFESYKKERGVRFFYYDMNNQAQIRQYFDKLSEYQIHYKEWESIIKKVNLKESGLSDLFADCRDEKGLVEKWFLEAVEDKLNKDRNRMKEFQTIVEKYAGQYRDNQSKIQRRDAIQAFSREAEQIREKGVDFQRAETALFAQKARIGVFLRALRVQQDEEEKRLEDVERQKEVLKEQLLFLEYEKLSGEFYEALDRERYAAGNVRLLEAEREDLERIRNQIENKLHLLACARGRENAAEEAAELWKEKDRLALCLAQDADLEPERRRLGRELFDYYERRVEELRAGAGECQEEISKMEREKEENQENLEELRGKQGNLQEKAGAFQAVIGAYDQVEEEFNREYQESFGRNLLGEYEAGIMQIRCAEYEKEVEETTRARATARQEAERLKERQKEVQRSLEERRADKIRLEEQRVKSLAQLSEYDAELKERRVILKYFELEEDVLFNKEQILLAAERRLADTDLARQRLAQEENILVQEHERLARGQMLVLPEDLKKLLEEAGIHYVYGMEWLKKNQYTLEQNQKLAAQHPFLPYALILSAQELLKLSRLPQPAYTSFPVPILLREELDERGEAQESAVCSFDKVSFYVWFNEQLLDVEKLEQMLAGKAAKIEKVRGVIAQKQTEYQEYFEKKERIKLQKVTSARYEETKEEEKRLTGELKSLDEALLLLREELLGLEREGGLKEQLAMQLERELLYGQRRLSDFQKLVKEYEKYRENRAAFEKNERELKRVLEQQELKKGILKRLEQELITDRNRLAALERGREEAGQKGNRFVQYSLLEEEDLLLSALTPQAAAEAEGRYDVITGGIGAEQKELEERVAAAGRRYEKAHEALLSLQEKYGLSREAFEGISYDKKEERHQEKLLEEQSRRLSAKEKQIQEEQIKHALLTRERENKEAEIRSRCGKQEPMAKEEIRNLDFLEAIRTVEYERHEAEERGVKIGRRLQGLLSNLTALAEYEEFAQMEAVDWECDLENMEMEAVTRSKGLLVRDYHSCMEQRREAGAALERVLNQVIRKEQFAEEFYQKPLESMLQLAGDADRLLRQLEVTLGSYSNLMEKLMVDISMVEKEKTRIVELLGEYLREVHENLAKIDRNSTITIREKPVKMLKIELPDWAENEGFYGLRLLDYIDDITKRGIALLEENKNVQEYLGAKVTTKALYDAVVGVGSVQIGLYKVEAQREYPITWAEVAKNSGGEGFLSAFVILSALLYYMRRDDGDIFADRNEGKVLLMDNPFAQTNAAHLLKPLMDMAKKVNTQLICLSGLGGEAIYSRFDNIYVLNLIAANLRSGMQYLKAEHMRGVGEETLLPSQIQVVEQLEFEF